ncbi:hypothetical protein FPOA_00223 [Fusarium poae]|uniref:Methyltransferase type 11 domain-containing protein n=1 Tax=Fusarium poae TaxID=36050 RepID=A0A1B8B0N1_FUSPO|nr:hypothetical protein FPOA_00223 [Fusarium poae]
MVLSSGSPLAICPVTMSSTPELSTTKHFNKTADKYETNTGGATRELAQHAINFITDLKPLTSESKILDNACGTGIVTDTIVHERFSSQPNVHTAVMGGEELSFSDNTFTHSITSLGIMYFTDPDKGACEIARTLHPDGVAVVTGWMMMGHIKIIREVQAQIRPDDTPFKPPVSDIWLDPEHTKAVLSDAGLDVRISTTVDVYLGGETADAVADLLTHGFGSKVFGCWSEGEKEKGAEVMKTIVRESAVPFTRSSGPGVGIKSTASVFVACKGSSRVSDL